MLKSSTRLRSIITEGGTNLPPFCPIFKILEENKQILWKILSLACLLHTPLPGCVGVAEVGKITQWCYQEESDAPDITLKRNNCKLTPADCQGQFWVPLHYLIYSSEFGGIAQKLSRWWRYFCSFHSTLTPFSSFKSPLSEFSPHSYIIFSKGNM